jgi:TonB-dependent starch-binding outer membrane protein SusC
MNYLKTSWQKTSKLLRHFSLVQAFLFVVTAFNGINTNAQSAIDQRITLSANNATLQSVFKQLESQTGYQFRYADDVMNDTRKFSFSFSATPLNNALKRMAAEAGFEYKTGDKSITVKLLELKKITGKITDADNKEPLIGVSVALLHTNKGTVSDANGHFEIEAFSSSILAFSFLGFQNEQIVIGTLNTVDIALKSDIKTLEGVVIVGYGSLSKREVTNSIASVSRDKFNQTVASSPAQLLQGKVAGLNVQRSGDPNATPNVILRGASTLREGAAQQPFYVIDGIPGASISTVAPDDIVSIDVLRDASAAAIYGTRAANGVILITTRKPVNNNSYISYSGYTAIEQVAKRIEMLSGDELRKYLSDNNKALGPDDNDGVNTDWQNEVMRTGISQNHNLSFGGGDKKTLYSANINYLQNEGIMKGSSLNRLIAKANIEQRGFNDKLTVGLSLSHSQTKQELIPYQVFTSMLTYLPTVNIHNTDGTYKENWSRSASYLNPVSLIETNTHHRLASTTMGSGKIKLDITNYLTYDATLFLQQEQNGNHIYRSSKSGLAQNKNGYADRSHFINQKTVLENYLTYLRSWQEHQLKAMAGYSWQEDNNGDGFQVIAEKFVSDDLKYNNLFYAMTPSTVNPYGNTAMTTLRMISFFSRFNYQYKSRYMLQATLRRDGSSAFGVNNQWGNFPSVSAGWRISEESFMKNTSIINDLKLRGGYGVSGNSLGFDPLISILRYGNLGKTLYNGENIIAIGPAQNANPDLRWESTSMMNIGLDFSILNNRLSGTIEYYNKQTKDLIWTYDVSTTEYLHNKLTANVGKMSNKGVEMSVSSTPVTTQNFKWNTDVTLSHNTNKLMSLTNNSFKTDSVWTGDLNLKGQTNITTQILTKNKPVGQFHLWQYAGLDENGISLFRTAAGETTTTPTSKDYFDAGSAQPKLTFGWNNSFSFKNWDLNIFMRGVYGNKILNGTLATLNDPAMATLQNIPKFSLNEPITDNKSYFISNRYLEDGSYIRLDQVTIGYTIKNWGLLKSCRVYASGNNLHTFTKYSGIDPEVNMAGLTPGIDNKDYYPRTRSFMMGLNIHF